LHDDAPTTALEPRRDRGLLWRLAPKHPVPMRAVFVHCWLFTYAVPEGVLAAALPDGVAPDVMHGSAWLSILVARMVDMRPTFAPRAFGVDFDQVVYRAATRVGDVRGVTFLRTDANHRAYAWAGDLLTWFRFHYRPIVFTPEGDRWSMRVDAGDAPFAATVDHAVAPDAAPVASPFRDLADAAALTERYHALHRHPRTGALRAVTVNRGPKRARFVGTPDVRAPWVDAVLPGSQHVLTLYAPDIAYRWTRARALPTGER